MAQTTFLVDVVDAIMAVLNAQVTATPTQLRKAYVSRPGGYGETPFAFIGDRTETITHIGQTRERRVSGLTVWVCDLFVDASETADRLDLLQDLLVERFTEAKHGIPGGGGLLQTNGVSDTEISFVSTNQQTSTLRARVFAFPDTFILEGRA